MFRRRTSTKLRIKLPTRQRGGSPFIHPTILKRRVRFRQNCRRNSKIHRLRRRIRLTPFMQLKKIANK